MKWLKYSILMLLMCSALSLNAADYPNRPVTLLIGFERGGTAYTQAEVLAEVLADNLGQPVSLQRKSGLGGGIAAAMLASSKSEGYIVLFTPSFPITDYPPNVQASYSIDDFRYIGAVSEDQHALVTSRFAPFNTWAEFLQYARQQGEISYVSQNMTDRHLIQTIAEKEGFEVRIIPVSGGAGMAPLVLSGDVDLAFSGGTHSRYSDTGEMRVLAATGQRRLEHYPDIPTLEELGYPLIMQSVRLLAVPKDTPEYQVEVLIQATRRALEDPRFIQVTQEVIRQPIRFIDGEELNQFLYQQRQRQLQLLEHTHTE
ncbi:MAG: tripartite tricarboxylate transporter substrate binding protein [Nitrincola lacisaponensis]|uniref:Putative exported protein n=1 Tax=Nitrincola lacisaponensis TaxID=267850 RepID=A0A063Y8C8_9GAMM|nr:tripartite tricarboxylate transporter substrate binding protein [Nitrincola lacisaponensis]KDE41370.1 putative exported protein [Nitrincola lacisaponensis]